jgi:hypothetical protein
LDVYSPVLSGVVLAVVGLVERSASPDEFSEPRPAVIVLAKSSVVAPVERLKYRLVGRRKRDELKLDLALAFTEVVEINLAASIGRATHLPVKVGVEFRSKVHACV